MTTPHPPALIQAARAVSDDATANPDWGFTISGTLLDRLEDALKALPPDPVICPRALLIQVYCAVMRAADIEQDAATCRYFKDLATRLRAEIGEAANG